MSPHDLRGWRRELVQAIQDKPTTWVDVTLWSGRQGLVYATTVRPFLQSIGVTLVDGALCIPAGEDSPLESAAPIQDESPPALESNTTEDTPPGPVIDASTLSWPALTRPVIDADLVEEMRARLDLHDPLLQVMLVRESQLPALLQRLNSEAQ